MPGRALHSNPKATESNKWFIAHLLTNGKRVVKLLWLYGTLVTLICIAHRVTSSELNIFGGQGIRDALAERDLMGAIQIPLQNGVKFVDGLDGFPAFGVTSEADLKSPFKLILSDHLQDFAIIATVRPQSSSGGWVFSVVNSLDTVVQLGLLLEPTASGDQWNATLYYTDAKKERNSQPLASFQVPYGKSWMKMIFKVLPDQVVFYYNCLEAGVVPVKKEPRKLVFDSASTVYIGQAGPILKQKFEVSAVYQFFINLAIEPISRRIIPRFAESTSIDQRYRRVIWMILRN
uniref:Thrombospondin-like N-terminal domain-containing protein n=1 Tax=Anopheles culicifacies TaxID=139723 RepID=A0A182LSA2_9DIPT